MAFYELRSENLTGLGGPMGTERTWDNFRRHFSSKGKAKEAARLDYEAHGGKHWRGWVKERDDYVRTPDLGFVMYHITELKAEDE